MTPKLEINFLPAETIDALDRGLHYGDGVFETIAVSGGRPELWERHLTRLETGCARLAMPMPDRSALRESAERLAKDMARAVLKIIVTRGVGGRGYAPPEQVRPNVVAGLYPWPDYPQAFGRSGVTMRIAATRLGDQPLLAGIKHLNRLEQVLARGEWREPAIAEALMRDGAGNAIEATQSNIFAVIAGILATPDLSRAGVAGVMRELVLERAAALELAPRIEILSLDDVLGAEEIFLTNSVIGVWPVRKIIGEGIARDYAVGPATRRIADDIAIARAKS